MSRCESCGDTRYMLRGACQQCGWTQGSEGASPRFSLGCL